MNINNLLKGSCIAFSTVFLLSGCGGGGGSSSSGSSSSSSTKAFLIDAAVSGVKYVNADGSTGFTSNDGSFDYKSGTTKFYVGEVQVGEISNLNSDSRVFLQDIVKVDRSNINHPKVVKLAKFLQTIDSDGDASNGINTKDAHSKFSTKLDVLDSNTDVDTLLTSNSYSVKTEADVKNHLKSELQKRNISVDEVAPALVSSNTNNSLSVSSNITVTFNDELLAETVNNSTVQLKKKSTNALVTSTVFYDNASKTIVVNPNEDLEPSVDYVLVISTALQDKASNPLASQITLNFSTIAQNDSIVPTVSIQGQAQDILLSSNIELKFSEAMKKDTINNTNIVLKDEGNNTVNAVVTYNEANFVATINPENNLQASSSYTVKLKSAIKDLAGNPLAEKEIDLTTINQNLAQAPQISQTSLDSNSVGIKADANITITFSKEIDKDTLNDNIKIRKDGKSFDISTNITVNGNVVTVNPSSLLDKDSNYSLTIKNGIKDLQGNLLDISNDRVINFSVEAQVDNSRPVLVEEASSISNNAKNIAINSNFTFTFSEDIKPDTLSDSSIILEDSNSNAVAKTFTYSSKVLTITPSSDLSHGTTYKLKLTTAITDLKGNKFDGNPFASSSVSHDKVISFTTIANSNDNTAPTLVSSNNLGTIAKDAQVVITFSEELKEINNSNYTNYLTIPSGYSFSKYENKKIYINAATSLNEYDTSYQIVLKNTIADLKGNTLANQQTITFKTALEADNQGPRKTSSNPSDNALNVNADSNLTITFDEAIETNSVNATNIKLAKKDDKNTNLISDGEVSVSSNIITINPTNNLDLNTDYVIIIKKDGIKDSNNNAFEGSFGADEEINFKTRMSNSSASCDAGYSEYLDKCYKIYTSSKTQLEANNQCTSEASSLVEISMFNQGGFSLSLAKSFADGISLVNGEYWLKDKKNQFGRDYGLILKSSFGSWSSGEKALSTNPTLPFICVKN